MFHVRSAEVQSVFWFAKISTSHSKLRESRKAEDVSMERRVDGRTKAKGTKRFRGSQPCWSAG